MDISNLQADQYSSETSWLITDETGMVGEESPGVIYSNSFNQNTVFYSALHLYYIRLFGDVSVVVLGRCLPQMHAAKTQQSMTSFCRTNHTIEYSHAHPQSLGVCNKTFGF